jgi:hypothetical protein
MIPTTLASDLGAPRRGRWLLDLLTTLPPCSGT